MKKNILQQRYKKNIEKYWPGIKEKEWSNWKWQLKNSINTADNLNKLIPGLDIKKIIKTVKLYPFSITPHYLALSDLSNINDPVIKQVIPDISEIVDERKMDIDPFEEQSTTPVPNLFKRYPDRVVLAVTNKCASYCRFCTRKWNWNNVCEININKVVQYLKENKIIREVIISGGEPFLIPLKKLDNIIEKIISLKNIDAVRIGTRILSFLPQRINKNVIKVLSKYKPVWIMTHFNHVNEIGDETEKAAAKLIKAGTVICNQSVLLKGINDKYKTMRNLMRFLQKIRIKPYYIFQCDLIKGTEKFHSSIEKGISIIKKMRGNMGGVCIPNYMIDIPKGGKVPILPEYIINKNKKYILLKNFEGKKFKYPIC